MRPRRDITERDADSWAAELSDYSLADYLRVLTGRPRDLPTAARNAVMREASERLLAFAETKKES
jgi:hypothetical protein